MTRTAPDATVPFEVLHALSVKGLARPDQLAASLGCPATDVDADLARLSAGGLASHLASRGLWRLTREGQARHAGLLEEQLPGPVQHELRSGYLAFVPMNRQLKEICTGWQLQGSVPNDHSDTVYDQDRVAELTALHEAVTPVISQLAAARARFGRYGRRLTAALARLRDGDPEAFTGVLADSYHDIWMELHRDLLLSLRIDRKTEETAAAERAAGSDRADGAGGSR